MANDIETLRAQATALGIKFSGNTGAKTLKNKIAALTPHLSPASVTDILGDDSEPLPEVMPKAPMPKRAPSMAELEIMDINKIDPNNRVLIRKAVRARAMALSRVIVVNLDPDDSELPGAIVTVQNKYTGRVSKFIPFGEGTGNGWHVPRIILNHLREQKFVIRKAIKGSPFGVKTYKSTRVPKFAITVLPPLTQDELNVLAAAQAASGEISNEEA